MKSTLQPWSASLLGAVVLTLVSPSLARGQGVLTLQVGTPPPDPVQLVAHGDTWRYREGTSEPPADWTSVPDASLDASWLSGPGGFGFGDADDGTTLANMRGNYLSVYTRKTFNLPQAAASNLKLRLTVDWDDGFVAYLDGVHLTNSANVPAVPHPANQGVVPDHPAVVDGGALGIFDLGAVGSRLGAGDHVLAVQGINGDLASSDVSLAADLYLIDETGGGVLDGVFALVPGDSVLLSGTNTLVGATRVTVNGQEASFDPGSGLWSYAQDLNPGMNTLFIASLDASGNLLGAITKEIISEQSSLNVSGTLTGDQAWLASDGIIHVTGNLTLAAGAILDIQPGVVILVNPGLSINVQSGATLNVNGSSDSPVYFRPANAASNWDQLAATGVNAQLNIRHADISYGRVRFLSNASGLMEDSHVHNFFSGSTPVVAAVDAASLTVRRCHFEYFHETLFQRTPMVVEDSLIENAVNASSDAVDFDGAPPGSTIRRSTFRNGLQSNTDGIDIGPSGASSIGVIIEDCLMRDFTDKGVSIGEDSFDITVRNCLIFDTTIGVQVKDISTATIHDCTIVGSDIALHGFEKTVGTGGGRLTNTFNNILAFNLAAIAIEETIPMPTEIVVNYTDTFGTNWPGIGNINADPMFVNAAGEDFRLQPGSPCVGTGMGGADMGVTFPVGGLPPVPYNVLANSVSESEIAIRWEEDADNEYGFIVERSADGATWTVAGMAAPNTTNYVDGSLGSSESYLYRVRATNHVGQTRFSNLAGARTMAQETVVGGTLTQNTSWTSNDGSILVQTSVVVPAGITLSVHPGVPIRLSPGTSITAQGGVIDIQGSAEAPVVLDSTTSANWNQLAATGAGASLTVRHAEITKGQVRVLQGAAGLLEDCHIHDYLNGSTPIISTANAASMTLRRCHVAYYHETLFQTTLMLIEDCLFEFPINDSSDAVDFDGAPPGSVIRRSTFRNGLQPNTDAIDLGPTGPSISLGVIIEDCLMYDFADKGVSIGEDSQGITVRNCLIYNTGSGIQVKDISTATIHDCTIVDSVIGLHGFEKTVGTGGGRMTNTFNNILAFNGSAITIEDAIPLPTEIVVHYTDSFGLDWPTGTGNINADPLFRDAAGRDYRLLPGSPCIGTGEGGTTMGVSFPIGGLPEAPDGLQLAGFSGDVASLTWNDNSTRETSFRIEISSNGVEWTPAATAPQDATGADVGGLSEGPLYFFRVLAVNFIGDSFPSDPVASSGDPNDIDGDGLPNDWESANGLNPNDPTDADEDDDTDGVSNRDEYQAGTDPQDDASVFKIAGIQYAAPDTVRLIFNALANRTYEILFKDAMGDAWQSLISIPANASDRLLTFTDSPPPGTGSRFYQLRTPAP